MPQPNHCRRCSPCFVSKSFPTLLAQLFTSALEELLHEDDTEPPEPPNHLNKAAQDEWRHGSDYTDKSRYSHTEFLADVFSPLIWPECCAIYLETQSQFSDNRKKKQAEMKREKDDIANEHLKGEEDGEEGEFFDESAGVALASDEVTTEAETDVNTDASTEVATEVVVRSREGENDSPVPAATPHSPRRQVEDPTTKFLGGMRYPLRTGLGKLKKKEVRRDARAKINV